jgi:hypothetical protein
MAGDEAVSSAGGAEFRAALAPTVEAIRQLTVAVGAVQPNHRHQPAVPSVAIDEIAAEARGFGTRTDWDGPIRDTHTFGGTTLFAASDYARSRAELFAADRTPVYRHLSVARSALETSVVAAWLNDPTVDPSERVRRGLCEQLYNAGELVRLGLEPVAKQRLQGWQDVATEFGWSVVWDRDKPRVESSQRPSVPAGIDQLLLGDGNWKLGKVQWSYLSAVDHGTWYGLRQSILEPPQGSAIGPSLAGVGTTAAGVRSQAVCVLRAVRKAATARFTSMGWLDDEWAEASRRAEKHETELIRLSQAP